MLLRDERGEAVVEKEKVQDLLFKQIDQIFRHHDWPRSRNRKKVQGVEFNLESIQMLQDDITEQEVHHELVRLRGGKSAGSTDIPQDVLKKLSDKSVENIMEWCM